jgi:hypothetical protein
VDWERIDATGFLIVVVFVNFILNIGNLVGDVV